MTIAVNVSRKLGAFAFKIAFDAPAGFTVITGPSGSGKTTLLNLIAGLLKPDTGRIAIRDEILFDQEKGIAIAAHKRRIGYVFQEARLFPHLSVRHNLTYGRWFTRAPEGAPSVEEVSTLLGIEHLLKRRPHNLSGGERQRVAIGRALLSAPRLLLMDEPLSALDKSRRDEIVPYLERLREKTAIPILYTTHNMDEVVHLMTAHVALGE